MRDTHLTLKISRLWLAIVVSILVHLFVVLGWWPRLEDPDKKKGDPGDMTKTLSARLRPAPQPQPAPREAPTPPPVAAPKPQEPPPRAAKAPAKPRQAPPVLTRPTPAPPTVAAAPTPAPSQPAPPAPPTPATDLSAMIEARRRARGEAPAEPVPPAPVEDETARRNRIVEANMATIRSPTLGDNMKRSGGVFELRRVGIYDAEFLFFGWNKDVNRRMSQVIEVKLGNNSSIQLAIVRRMIAIVREHEKEDFTWSSGRIGRVTTLSARLSDNAALEAFLMREFF